MFWHGQVQFAEHAGMAARFSTVRSCLSEVVELWPRDLGDQESLAKLSHQQVYSSDSQGQGAGHAKPMDHRHHAASARPSSVYVYHMRAKRTSTPRKTRPASGHEKAAAVKPPQSNATRIGALFCYALHVVLTIAARGAQPGVARSQVYTGLQCQRNCLTNKKLN